jgi:hypothetical protein
MLKKTLIAVTLPLLSLLAISVDTPLWGVSAQPVSQTAHSAVATDPGTGTLQKMIVQSGSVTMEVDLNGLNGSDSLVARPVTLQFAVGANSFFPILVFNDLLRGPEPRSMALIRQNSVVGGGAVVGIGNAGVADPGREAQSRSWICRGQRHAATAAQMWL